MAAEWPQREARRPKAVRHNDGGERVVSSCIFVKGLIRRIERIEEDLPGGGNVRVRACLVEFKEETQELGECIDGVAVTAYNIVTAAADEAALATDFEGRLGVFVLGLARDGRTPHTSIMMLVGFLSKPRKRFLETWELKDIFFSTRNAMMLNRQREVFLDFVRSIEEEDTHEFGNDIKGKAKILANAYSNQVEFHETIGCAVIFKPFGNASNYPVCYVVAPSSVGNFKREGIYLYVPTVDSEHYQLSAFDMRRKYCSLFAAKSAGEKLVIECVIECVNALFEIDHSGSRATPHVAAEGGGQKLLNAVNNFFFSKYDPAQLDPQSVPTRGGYKELMVEYQLYLINKALDDSTPFVTGADLRAIFEMLHKTLGKIEKFVSHNLAMVMQRPGLQQGPHFKMSEQVEGWRRRMDEFFLRLNQMQASVCKIKSEEFTFLDTVSITTKNVLLTSLLLPPLAPLDVDAGHSIESQLAGVETDSPSVNVAKWNTLEEEPVQSMMGRLLQHFKTVIVTERGPSRALSVEDLQLLKDFRGLCLRIRRSFQLQRGDTHRLSPV